MPQKSAQVSSFLFAGCPTAILSVFSQVHGAKIHRYKIHEAETYAKQNIPTKKTQKMVESGKYHENNLKF